MSILKKCEELMPSEISKNGNYDGNDLSSACEFHHIGADNWAEIIRYEQGINEGIKQSKSKLPDILQVIKKECNKIDDYYSNPRGEKMIYVDDLLALFDEK